MDTMNDRPALPNQILPTVAVTTPRHLNRVGLASAVVTAEPTTLGARMVYGRLKLGLTQASVAGTVRGPSGRLISRNTYCMYESGKNEPCLATIEQIATTLQVSPGWLAWGHKQPIKESGEVRTKPFFISFRWSGHEVRTIGGVG